MKAVLVTDFPDRFVNESILPELTRRVEVVLVATHQRAQKVDLASYAPDVVLQMIEMTGHSTSDALLRSCRALGIPLQALSRKKSSWTFLPPPKEIEMNQPSKQHTNGRATLGDAPGVREALSAVPTPPASAIVPKPDPMAEAIQAHAQAMTFLARAITEATAAILAGAEAFQAAKAPAKAAPKRTNPLVEAVDMKLLELVEKFPNLCATDLHVLVTTGAGGEKVKATQQMIHDRLAKLCKDDVLRREGAGGASEPYRYFPAESST